MQVSGTTFYVHRLLLLLYCYCITAFDGDIETLKFREVQAGCMSSRMKRGMSSPLRSLPDVEPLGQIVLG